MYGVIQLLYKQIHVVTSPVAYVAETLWIVLKILLIGNLTPCNGVGVEVVIYVQSVNIVTTYDISHYPADIVAILLFCRIEQIQSVIGKHQVRTFKHYIVACKLVSHLCFRTERVYPCMKFHTTLVAFVNHPLQRVPIWHGCHTLLSCQETAPWLYATFIQGITFWSHLEYNGINTILLQLIKLVCECLLHFLCPQTHELTVYALNPCTAKLSLWCCIKETENGEMKIEKYDEK